MRFMSLSVGKVTNHQPEACKGSSLKGGDAPGSKCAKAVPESRLAQTRRGRGDLDTFGSGQRTDLAADEDVQELGDVVHLAEGQAVEEIGRIEEVEEGLCAGQLLDSFLDDPVVD